MEGQTRIWSRGPTAIDALTSWSMSPPPTGDAQAARDRALALASEPSLRNTIPHQVFAADGLPYLTIATLEQRTAQELARGDQMALQLKGQLLADALDRVATLGTPSEAALLAWLTSNGENEIRPTAHELTSALSDYWRGAYDASAARAIPNIEAALRHLVLLINEPAYVAARTGTPGKYLGIDPLLKLLSHHGFDPDWDHALRAFLLGPYGMNVRNDFAHGFQLQMHPRVLAALSIRMLLLLVRMGGKPDTAPKSIESTVPIVSVSTAIAQLAIYARQNPAALPGLLHREMMDAKRACARNLRSKSKRPTYDRDSESRHQD